MSEDDDDVSTSTPTNVGNVGNIRRLEPTTGYGLGVTTEGTLTSSSEEVTRRRMLVTMDGLTHAGSSKKIKRTMDCDATRILEMGKDMARGELFDKFVFYPAKECWNLNGNFGKHIVEKCALPVDWDNPDNMAHWERWWKLYNASKKLREAHTRRRRTVVERVKSTFVGKCRGHNCRLRHDISQPYLLDHADLLKRQDSPYDENWMEMVKGMRSSQARGKEYAEMLDTFGPAVCRTTHWKKNHKKTLSEMMTPRLEAFLILLLENMVSVEVENYEIEKKKKEAARARNTRSSAGGAQEVEIPKPKEQYKYILGVGERFCNDSPATCNGYFHQDGIFRFYAIVKKVLEDRRSEAGKKIEEEFKQKKSKQQLAAPPPGLSATIPSCFPTNWYTEGLEEETHEQRVEPMIPTGLNEDV